MIYLKNMPSRIQVVEKVNDSIDSNSSSSFDDRYDGDETTLQNTSIALLARRNEIGECSKDSSTCDPDETRLEDSIHSEKLFDPNETSLDVQGCSQRHLIMDQTLLLTLTPVEHSKIERSLSQSPSDLVSRFPEISLEKRNEEYDVQQQYENKFRPIVKNILDANGHVRTPSFSSSANIDERISHLYEIMKSNANIRKVLSEIGWNKENFLASGGDEASKINIHPSTPEILNIHESQEHSFNLSNANVLLDSNVQDARELSSIEIARADVNPQSEFAHSFQSPVASAGGQGIKRLASISGKRGMDRKKGIIHGNTPEDEKLVNDSYGESDPFEAYNEFSQHVNDIMMDSPSINVHKLSDASNDDSSSFMRSALQSQSSDVSSILKNGGSNDCSSKTDRLRKHGTTESVMEKVNDTMYQDNDLYNSFERHDVIHADNSFQSPQSNHSVSSDSGEESSVSSHVVMSNTDSIIEEEDGYERSVSLQPHSRLCFNPLDLYRPPKWAKAYSKRKINKNKRNNEESQNETKQQNQKMIDRPRHLPTSTWVQEPFKDFGSREADRMEVLLEWLNDKDEGTDVVLPHRAVLLSLKMRQIISIAVQVLVHNGVHSIPQSERHLDERSAGAHYKAGTLIVARDKSCLLMWDCFLREKTSFSVLNHAELPSTERRRALLPTRASSYDIVLTTYDSLKMKEINVAVDEKGRAIPQVPSQGRWMSSRAPGESETEQQQCETVSQLHTLDWYRLIFIDVLGRQGYLTKPTTVRSQTSVILRGGRRIVFFDKSDDEHEYFFEDKLKDSRRQLSPLARLLDISERLAGDQLVGSTMLDYRDIKECHDVSRLSEWSDSSSILTEA